MNGLDGLERRSLAVKLVLAGMFRTVHTTSQGWHRRPVSALVHRPASLFSQRGSFISTLGCQHHLCKRRLSLQPRTRRSGGRNALRSVACLAAGTSLQVQIQAMQASTAFQRLGFDPKDSFKADNPPYALPERIKLEHQPFCAPARWPYLGFQSLDQHRVVESMAAPALSLGTSASL